VSFHAEQSYPATRHGKITGTEGEEGEEQSLFSPRCPWWALPADAGVRGPNCCISWAISFCLAGHCPPPQCVNTSAGGSFGCPLLGKVWGHHQSCPTPSIHGRTLAPRDPALGIAWTPTPQHPLLVPARLARGFTSSYTLAL